MKTFLLFLLFIPQFLSAQIVTQYDTINTLVAGEKSKMIIRSEGKLLNGVNVGVWKSWYPNGQLKDSTEYVMITDENFRLLIPDFRDRVDTMALRESTLNKKSMCTGKSVSYFSNGKISETGSYSKLAIAEINFTLDFDENGNEILAYSYPFDFSRRIGNWKYYNEDGTISAEENYDEDGRFIEK